MIDEGNVSHDPEDLIQLPGRQYHIHKQDIDDGSLPMEVSVFLSLLQTLEINPEELSSEKFLLCCERIYTLMTDMLDISKFGEDDEN